jgi:pSer/pThr/pTyr-binding forkhead associated (FHA) protein
MAEAGILFREGTSMGANDTISGGSNLGKRLGKIRHSETVYLHHGKRKTQVTDRISIGRSRDCDIVIEDNLASRYHALVQKIKNAYFICDMESTNGVRVNGETIEPGSYVRLHSTDRITIGRTEFHFKIG